jgi:hypothetical protein
MSCYILYIWRSLLRSSVAFPIPSFVCLFSHLHSDLLHHYNHDRARAYDCIELHLQARAVASCNIYFSPGCDMLVMGQLYRNLFVWNEGTLVSGQLVILHPGSNVDMMRKVLCRYESWIQTEM